MIDCCPGCKREFPSSVIRDVLKLRGGQSMLAICTKCAEVIYLYPVGRYHISGMVPTREMMIGFGMALRLRLHEEQEQAHFANGHWG